MKKLLKKLILKLNLNITRNYPGFYHQWIPISEKKLDILELLIKIESVNERCKFLQIGANDGLRADPLRKLIEKYKMYGALIEPMPWTFRNLVDNYKNSCDDLNFENIAISVDGDCGTTKIYYFESEDKILQDSMSGYSSMIRERLERIKFKFYSF